MGFICRQGGQPGDENSSKVGPPEEASAGNAMRASRRAVTVMRRGLLSPGTACGRARPWTIPDPQARQARLSMSAVDVEGLSWPGPIGARMAGRQEDRARVANGPVGRLPWPREVGVSRGAFRLAGDRPRPFLGRASRRGPHDPPSWRIASRRSDRSRPTVPIWSRHPCLVRAPGFQPGQQ